MITLIVIAVILVLVITFGTISYVKAAPDKAYIISGFRKEPKILIGRAGFKIPFLERLDKLDLSLIPVDVKTSKRVPTSDFIDVQVDSNVNIRIGTTPELLSRAATHFLNKPLNEVRSIAQQVLEGSMREIVGQMQLEEMVHNRQRFNDMVAANAKPDLAEMGLDLINFNVQSFTDEKGVIENLGVDNVEQIRKKAAIAKSAAKKEIAIAEAENAKLANDARAEAQEAMNERNAQMETKQAELKRKVDTEQAQANAAAGIEAENQRKLKDVAATDANIAKAEREAELRQREVQLKEYELDALVRKQADAEKYAAEQKAAAELIRRQKDAEAKAYEIKQNAEAMKAQAEAEKYAAEQKAAGIAAVGAAEAAAIEKKAEAQKKMGEASVLEMYFDMLPKAVANAAAPLTNVDSITMYGEGNSAKMVADVMKSTDQVVNAINQATGVDVKTALSSFLGSKTANS